MLRIFVGLPGSGKSTVAKKIAAEEPAMIICPDDIRSMLKGCYDNYTFDSEHEGVTWSAAKSIFSDIADSDNFDIIIDATNMNERSREQWIELGRTYGMSIEIIWVNTPKEVCIDRRLKETKDCDTDWVAIINRMADSFEDPRNTGEEYDKLTIIV